MRRLLAGIGRSLGRVAEHHARAAVGALGRGRKNLISTLMTAAVIGISLALPATFLAAIDNIRAVAEPWESGTRASLFLNRDIDPEARADLAGRVIADDGVAAMETIEPDEALAEFETHSGLSNALDMLEENPLPAVLVVTPAARLDADGIDALIERLRLQPGVDDVRLDRQWVRRLHAIMSLALRTVWLITLLLAITVVLVVGNTIRLDIENRRQEIVITKLIGATDAFVRRPFLYAGLWYGVAGGVVSWLLVEVGRWALAEPVDHLAGLYGSGFRLLGIGASGGATLIACGAFLGLIGSWLAVARHLSAIEPR